MYELFRLISKIMPAEKRLTNWHWNFPKDENKTKKLAGNCEFFNKICIVFKLNNNYFIILFFDADGKPYI